MMAPLYDIVEYTNRMAWRPPSALFALDSKRSIDMDSIVLLRALRQRGERKVTVQHEIEASSLLC